MSDLDSTQGNPAFSSKPRVPKDALANARLARNRETQEPVLSPDPRTADWDLLRPPPA